jgi:hypothetical protein
MHNKLHRMLGLVKIEEEMEGKKILLWLCMYKLIDVIVRLRG